jgi:hypothetical protein
MKKHRGRRKKGNKCNHAEQYYSWNCLWKQTQTLHT